MNSWIKIDNDIFFIKESSLQFSTAAHATVDICVDLALYPQYLQHFFNLFQNHTKFNLLTKDFEGKGTLIKSIDYDLESLKISLRCDLLNQSDKSERRDEIINELLNNQIKNNIN